MKALTILFAILLPQSLLAEPLRVSLFKWVPNQKAMEEVIQKRWQKLHPAKPLEWVKWDCYDGNPPSNIEVFETDAIFLDHMVANNCASPISLEDVVGLDDYMEFAIRGSMVDGVLYGVPRIACTPVLFYRTGDKEIEQAESLDDLFAAIGYSDGKSEVLPKNEGLLVSLEGGTTDACLFLDAIADLSNKYSTVPTLPGVDELDEDALASVRMLAFMAGRKQALFENWDDDDGNGIPDGVGQRSRWFAEGRGRALIGWTERLAHMPVEYHKNVSVRTLPLESHALSTDKTKTPTQVNLFFVDTLCINPMLRGERRKLAMEFVTLATSPEVVAESFLVKVDRSKSPQYLLPVRKSVIGDKEFLAKAPLYEQLWKFYKNSPRTFRIGEDSRSWLEGAKDRIRELITDIPPYERPETE